MEDVTVKLLLLPSRLDRENMTPVDCTCILFENCHRSAQIADPLFRLLAKLIFSLAD